MKKFKVLSLILTLAMLALVFASCGNAPAPAASSSAPAASSAAPSSEAPAASSSAPAATKPYIAIISKGFQHQFWQTVMKGAQDAAAKYNVDMTFDGPPTESDVNIQVDMLNAAIAKNPAALALAALDTESVTSQLNDLKAKGIPVVAFDSGVPNAPAGTVLATASTNNAAAGALAADQMFADPAFQTALKAATKDNPALIACLSQDATSASITGRTDGFTAEMLKQCETVFPGQVAITGHDKWAKPATSGTAVVNIMVSIPPSSSATDNQNLAQATLQQKGLIAVFCSNEATVGGILAATTDGTDLDKANGKYKNLIVVGFDAGKSQKAAVKNKYFLGSVTQDPYMIGYLSVELAVKAINGEKISDSDTGCKFYTSENMDQSDISILLYD